MYLIFSSQACYTGSGLCVTQCITVYAFCSHFYLSPKKGLYPMTQISNKEKKGQTMLASRGTAGKSALVAPANWWTRLTSSGVLRTGLVCLALFIVAMGFNLIRLG